MNIKWMKGKKIDIDIVWRQSMFLFNFLHQ